MKKSKSSKYYVGEKVFAKIKNETTGKYEKVLAVVVNPVKNSDGKIQLKIGGKCCWVKTSYISKINCSLKVGQKVKILRPYGDFISGDNAIVIESIMSVDRHIIIQDGRNIKGEIPERYVEILLS